MNAYQRGNRDALVWMSHVAQERAEIYMAEVEKCLKVMDNPINKVQSNAAMKIHTTSLWKSQAWKEVSALALRMSESIPEDPEDLEDPEEGKLTPQD